MFRNPASMLSGSVLSLCLFPALAQDLPPDEAEPIRRYTVEVIVFEYAENVGLGTEIFPPEEPDPIFDDVADVDEAGTPVFSDATVQMVIPGDTPADSGPDAVADEETEEEPLSRIDAILLLEDELSLQGVRDRLSLLDVYEPVLHTAWTQIAPPKDESEPLDLSFFGPAPDGLSGTLTLYLGRFLHLVVELELEDQASADSTDFIYEEPEFRFGDNRVGYDDNPFDAERGRIVYRISEDRIMRNEEVRYFDHPHFGVIATITRVEEPDPAEDLPLPLLPGGGQ